MIRKLMLVLTLCLLLIPLQTGAQADNRPRYAVTFAADQVVKVATLHTDDTWTVEPLAAPLLLGQYDAWLLKPRWTETGLLVGAGFPPGVDPASSDATFALHVYRYDPRNEELARTDAPVFNPVTPYAEWIDVSYLSPDSRYALVYGILGGQGAIVDLETMTVAAELPCNAMPITWEDGRVLLLTQFMSLFGCPVQLYWVDLTTGAIHVDMTGELGETPMLDGAYYEAARLLPDGRLLVAEAGMNGLWLVDLETYAVEMVATYGTFLTINEHGTRAAWVENSTTLVLLNLETLETTPVIDYATGVHFDGEILRFQQNAALGTFVDGEAALFPLYSAYTGAESLSYAPQGPRVAIFSPDEVITVYDSNELLMNVDVTVGEEFLYIEGYDYPIWSADGRWLHVQINASNMVYSNPADVYTISVNVETGEIIAAPMPGLHVVSESPDGAWWLYAGSVEDRDDDLYGKMSHLLAFNPATGELVTLNADTRLYENFHFPFQDYFVWSPPLE